jgi:hypothetical protein
MMDSPTLLLILALAAIAIGFGASFFTRRFPSRSWVGILLLISTGLVWTLIEPRESSGPSNWPMLFYFWLSAPTAVVYSFRTRKNAPDKLPALAAFVGSFIIAALFLFTSAGVVMMAYEIFTHAI